MLFFIVGVVSLAILIFVHELGHFLLAKYHGVGVVEFSIGFGRKVWSRQVGETLYSLRLIPLGGYVRMVGDDPRLLEGGSDHEPRDNQGMMGSDLLEGRSADEISEAERKMLADPSRWFLKKGFIPKFNIVLAGPVFNILFALLAAFASIAIYGQFQEFTDKPIIGSVFPGFPAAKAGVLPGDYVHSVNGKAVNSWIELATSIEEASDSEMVLDIERTTEGAQATERRQIKVQGTFETSEITALDDEPSKKRRAMIGISASFERTSVTIGQALQAAPMRVWRITVLSIRGIVEMIKGSISPKHLAGPIFIFGEAAKNAKRGVAELLDFMILLSISLAIFNLLPIPVLDGGHLLFFTIEALRGRPVSLRVQQYATQAGMVFLLGLMLFAVSNDLMRLF